MKCPQQQCKHWPDDYLSGVGAKFTKLASCHWFTPEWHKKRKKKELLQVCWPVAVCTWKKQLAWATMWCSIKVLAQRQLCKGSWVKDSVSESHCQPTKGWKNLSSSTVEAAVSVVVIWVNFLSDLQWTHSNNRHTYSGRQDPKNVTKKIKKGFLLLHELGERQGLLTKVISGFNQ